MSRTKQDDPDKTSSEEEEDGLLCTTCEAEFDKWSAQCPKCSAWATIKKRSEIAAEEAEEAEEADDDGDGDEDEDEDDDDSPGPLPIDQIHVDEKSRLPTGISELDRVLGGGAVLGGVTLIGGDPGVGKSTLLLQALASLSAQGTRTLYITGEEAASQVALRAMRIENVISKNLLVVSETRVEQIFKAILKVQPEVMVIDSVQTVHTKDGDAGAVTQLRKVTSMMIAIAQKYKISTFLVGHITKDGGLAGPKVLEHLVDTVLAFEGEKGQAFRTLRTQKNRYGSSTEVGIFEMTATGMRGVPNASEFFLAERNQEASGSIIAATSEGNRPMLVEVQALVSNVKIAGGRTVSNGIDSSRLATVMAVLEKIMQKQGHETMMRDIFVNVAGGVTISEPAMDLPIALAVASSLMGFIIPPNIIAFGEVGLTGEIRGVPRVPARIAEATTMGFKYAIVPKSASLPASSKTGKKSKSIQQELSMVPVRTLEEALSRILEVATPVLKTEQPKATKTNGVPRSARP
jgi:DNA repair protein RadA/Sms